MHNIITIIYNHEINFNLYYFYLYKVIALSTLKQHKLSFKNSFPFSRKWKIVYLCFYANNKIPRHPGLIKSIM